MKTPLTILMSLLLTLPAGSVLAMTSNPDGEVLGLIQAIDSNEIKAAQEAKDKNLDRKVADYAKMMEKEHSKNLDRDEKLAQKTNIQPVETAQVQNLRTQGADELSRLSPLQGAQFATAYIAAMVKDHSDALALIDAQKDSVQNKDLKKHVTATRDHVAKHLDEAKKIQDQLAKPQ